jgi:translation initiation factor IF-3
MPPTHISGTSRALYRVFVVPNIRAKTSIPLLYLPAFASPSYPSQSPSLTSHTIIRTKTYKKDTQRHALTDYYILDNAIQSPRINLVNEDGKYFTNVPITDALFKVNRMTHYLVQVTPGKVDEFGHQDPDDLPTCRIMSKMALREQHKRKIETLRRQAKGQTAGLAMKNLELNWAIAPGDLKHRLERLKEFLREGRKVEVLLGPKKRGRKASEEEANAVMKAVRDAVGECRGSSEVKSEGTVGAVLTVVFEGRKVEDKKEVANQASAT